MRGVAANRESSAGMQDFGDAAVKEVAARRNKAGKALEALEERMARKALPVGASYDSLCEAQADADLASPVQPASCAESCAQAEKTLRMHRQTR